MGEGGASAGALLLDGGDGSTVALVDAERVVSFEALRARVATRRDELGLSGRSLVVVESSNSVEFVVTYLALLGEGHVPLLVGDHAESLAAWWEADAIVRTGAGRWSIDRRSARADRSLHPDLALLLSTSGSTGSPKLVRLSHRNVGTNARAIGQYLSLTPTDRAITSLPLHYCYGLSVLHSHLAAGASVVMSSASVVDPCFEAAVHEQRVTTFAGVPHSFELLERVGPDVLHGPDLRVITQAGGRMPPERVRAWAARARAWGAELFVMYGQTEATARIAYLPPHLLDRHPQAIGRAVPGGCLELRRDPELPDGVGELVYRGPNVMLGYAREPNDLAAGATLDELVTGDLARYHEADDVFEIVGRRSRFVKPFGLRIDLDRVEATLVAAGIDAAVGGNDARLVVAAPDADPAAVTRLVVAATGLPASAVVVRPGAIPRTATGKVDYHALAPDSPADAPSSMSAAAVFAEVLGVPTVAPTATFVELGGDSLNYLECATRLEQAAGRLPPDWHLRTVAELDARTAHAGRPRLDATALLRAVGILAIVSTHMFWWYVPGGAHLMLTVVGYNYSRFHLSIPDARSRAIAVARTMARVAVPVVVYVGLCMLLVGGYGLPTLGLVNNYLGPVTHQQGRWHFWFIEAMVQLALVVTIVLAVPPLRRLERRHHYGFALALFALTLVLREHWVRLGGYDNLRFQTHGVAWCFVLGWLVHRSTTRWQRALTSVLCVYAVHEFFVRPQRVWFITVGVIVLIWWRYLPLPRVAITAVTAIAAASMAIYVSHFRVFPPLDRALRIEVAYLATITLGIAIWYLARRGTQTVRTLLRLRLRPTRRPARADAPDPAPALVPAVD